MATIDDSAKCVHAIRNFQAKLATVLFVGLMPGGLFRFGSASQPYLMDTGMQRSLLDIIIHVVVFALSYRLMSGNGAGGYYDGTMLGLGQITNLPRHLRDLYARHSGNLSRYRNGLLEEEKNGVFRTLNMLECSLGFMIFMPGLLVQPPSFLKAYNPILVSLSTIGSLSNLFIKPKSYG